MYVKFSILYRDYKTKSSFESHPFFINAEDVEELLSYELSDTDNALIFYGYYPCLPDEPYCYYQLER